MKPFSLVYKLREHDTFISNLTSSYTSSSSLLRKMSNLYNTGEYDSYRQWEEDHPEVDLRADGSIVFSGHSTTADCNPDHAEEDDNEEVVVVKQTTKARNVTWTKEEDLVLLSARFAISKDATTGTDQRSTNFWKRIHGFFSDPENNKIGTPRTVNQLMQYWKMINYNVGAWQNAYSQIMTTYQSRVNDINYLTGQVQQLYKQTKGTEFKLFHCWNVMKNEQQWKPIGEAATSKRQRNAECGAYTTSGSAGDLPDPDERPAGVKAAKEAKRKGKQTSSGAKSMSVDSASLMSSFQEAINANHERRNKMAEAIAQHSAVQAEKNALKAQKNDLKQYELDIQTVSRDITGMHGEELKTFEMLKKAAFRRLREKWGN